MEELINIYKVYIRTDNSNRVTAVNSSAFLFDPTGWTEIDEGAGDRYHHAQGHYLPKGLMTDDGIYRYKYTSDELQERTAEELQADRDAIPPAPQVMTVAEMSEILTALLKGEG